MMDSTLPCQHIDQRRFSHLLRPRWLVMVEALIGHLRTDGFKWTARKASGVFVQGLRRMAQLPPVPLRPVRADLPDEVLCLQPGEWVEVKSEHEILKTLDAAGNNRGLRFLPDMKAYCGSRFRVYRRVQKIYLEESKQLRTLRHTVLLSGVICRGAAFGCDRSCLYYWREAWLRRVDTPIDPTVRESSVADGRHPLELEDGSTL